MTKNVALASRVNMMVRRDLSVRGKTYDDVAEVLCKCPEQVGRQIRGENKLGIVSFEFLGDLRKANLVDEETVEEWPKSARQVLRFKLKK